MEESPHLARDQFYLRSSSGSNGNVSLFILYSAAPGQCHLPNIQEKRKRGEKKKEKARESLEEESDTCTEDTRCVSLSNISSETVKGAAFSCQFTPEFT